MACYFVRRQMLDRAASGWRDLLVAAGLADGDWQHQLTIERGEAAERAAGRPYRLLGRVTDGVL